jgi:hypothetical protein
MTDNLRHQAVMYRKPAEQADDPFVKNETLASIPVRLVFRPQIVIGGVHEKVRDGRLIDEAALSFALAGVEDLLEEISATRSVQCLTPR